MRSLPLVKMPRRMAWRVMMPKKISIMFIQDALVGVKVHSDSWVIGEPGFDVRVVVGGVVVGHDVQLHSRVCLSDRFEEGEELAVAVPVVAGVGGDLSGGDLERGEQGRGAVPAVVVSTAFCLVEAHR